MNRRTRIIALSALLLAAGLSHASVTTAAQSKPDDRVVVMYFHRTQRCPTCQKMGSYAEEAVQQGFAQQVADGRVEFHFIDFQKEANQALKKGYGVTGPSLIVAQVREGKVAEHKNLRDIWAKAGDKAAFLDYVREQVAAYLK